jgi:hypothetical protein
MPIGVGLREEGKWAIGFQNHRALKYGEAPEIAQYQ